MEIEPIYKLYRLSPESLVRLKFWKTCPEIKQKITFVVLL